MFHSKRHYFYHSYSPLNVNDIQLFFLWQMFQPSNCLVDVVYISETDGWLQGKADVKK